MLRTGLIVTLTGPATDGGRPLDRFLRVQAARSNASLSDVVLVVHVADRLSPWNRGQPSRRRHRVFLSPRRRAGSPPAEDNSDGTLDLPPCRGPQHDPWGTVDAHAEPTAKET